MIASSTLHISSLYLLFILYFLWYKLTVVLLIPELSLTQLYVFLQMMPSSLTLISVILFPLLELGGDDVHMEEFLLSLKWVKEEVFVVCHSLLPARGITLPNNMDKVLVCYLGIDILSPEIV